MNTTDLENISDAETVSAETTSPLSTDISAINDAEVQGAFYNMLAEQAAGVDPESPETPEVADNIVNESVEEDSPEIPELKTPYIVLRDEYATGPNDGELLYFPEESMPLEFYPKVSGNNVGTISRSLTCNDDSYIAGVTAWFKDIISRTKEIRRESFCPGAVKGFVMQQRPTAGGFLVECLSDTPVWLIIVDVRPNSASFQQFTIFKLNNLNQMKVWVPKGFLHGIYVPKRDVTKNQDDKFIEVEYKSLAHIQYFYSTEYIPEDELHVNPVALLQVIIQTYGDEFAKDKIKNYTLYGLLQTFSEGLIYRNEDKVKFNIKDLIDQVSIASGD